MDMMDETKRAILTLSEVIEIGEGCHVPEQDVEPFLEHLNKVNYLVLYIKNTVIFDRYDKRMNDSYSTELSHLSRTFV